MHKHHCEADSARFFFEDEVTVAVLSCTAAVINSFILDTVSESPAVRKFAVPKLCIII